MTTKESEIIIFFWHRIFDSIIFKEVIKILVNSLNTDATLNDKIKSICVSTQIEVNNVNSMFTNVYSSVTVTSNNWRWSIYSNEIQFFFVGCSFCFLICFCICFSFIPSLFFVVVQFLSFVVYPRRFALIENRKRRWKGNEKNFKKQKNKFSFM